MLVNRRENCGMKRQYAQIKLENTISKDYFSL